MFLKILKYDLKSIYRIFLLLTPITLGVCLLGGFGIDFLASSADPHPLITLISVLWIILSVFVISAYVIVINLFVYIRLYKHFFSDEGYLTFTLPIKRSTLLRAKSVNAMIWNILAGIGVFLGIGLMILPTAIHSKALPEIFQAMLITFKNIPVDSIVSIVIYIVGGTLIALTATWFNIELTQLCITVGSTITGKHKILASIGIYYAVNTVLTFGSQILAFLGAIPLAWLVDAVLSLPNPLKNIAVAISLFIFALWFAALAITCHVISLKRIKNHLNMA